MATIKNIIAKMLKENTGTHFLDSGGDNGRAWQRNQKINFEKTPRIEVDKYGVTVSTYHYLKEILSLDEVTKKVNSFITKNKLHWVDEVADEMGAKELFYYDLESFSETINTYNGENNLSQILLFKTFKILDNVYVLLQVHNGADVRGGYTDCKCFKLNGYLTGLVDIYGTIEGKEVSNTYNGYCLTWEEGNEEVDFEAVDLDTVEIDFCVMEETYMY
jgi:hypothetical protein